MEQVISQNRFAEGWGLKISNMDVTSSQSISAHSRFFLVQLHPDAFPFRSCLGPRLMPIVTNQASDTNSLGEKTALRKYLKWATMN